MNLLLVCALTSIFVGFIVLLLAKVDVANGKRASLPPSARLLGIYMISWGAVLVVVCAVAIYLKV